MIIGLKRSGTAKTRFLESLLSHYLLENPWPIGIISGMLGLILFISFVRTGETRLLLGSLTAVTLAGLVFCLDALIKTPAEHGEGLVSALVEAAEAGDVESMLQQVSPAASLHLGSVTRPGRPFSALQESFETLAGRNRITENWVIRLSGESDGIGGATVFLSCRTSTSSSYGLVPTTWSFEIIPDGKGGWEITRIVFESLMGRAPERGL